MEIKFPCYAKPVGCWCGNYSIPLSDKPPIRYFRTPLQRFSLSNTFSNQETGKVFKTSGWRHLLNKVNSVRYMQNTSQLLFIYLVVKTISYVLKHCGNFYIWEIFFTYIGEPVQVMKKKAGRPCILQLGPPGNIFAVKQLLRQIVE